MESEELRSIINQHLFIPITEELSDQLHNAVVSTVVGIDKERVSKYAKAVFRNRVDEQFDKTIRTSYREHYGESLEAPRIVLLVLQCYALVLALNTGKIEEAKKAQFSLIVRNYAITRKGNWDGLVCSKWLIDIYEYYENYSCRAVVKSNPYDSLLTSVIPNSNWDETGLEISDTDIYDQIRSLCVDGVHGKLNEFVSSFGYQNLSSPYTQVYVLVEKMVKEWNWKYISSCPVEIIRESLGDNAKKRKSLGKIVADVRAEIVNGQLFKPKEVSSVLLSCLYHGESSALDEQKFSVLEFGVYLYFEMLLETFND